MVADSDGLSVTDATDTIDTRLRLDNFLARYTSEDNAAFLDLQDADTQRRFSSLVALEAEQKRQASIAMLEDKSQPASCVFNPRTSVMYTPAGIEKLTTDGRTLATDPAREVRFGNTRLSTEFLRKQHKHAAGAVRPSHLCLSVELTQHRPSPQASHRSSMRPADPSRLRSCAAATR
jgi:hypothetical protein